MRKYHHKPKMESVNKEVAVVRDDALTISVGGSLPRSYRVVAANPSHLILESKMSTRDVLIMSAVDGAVVCVNDANSTRLMGTVVGVMYSKENNAWMGMKSVKEMGASRLVQVGDVLTSMQRAITVRMIMEDGSIAYDFESGNGVTSGFLSIRDVTGSNVYEIVAESVEWNVK